MTQDFAPPPVAQARGLRGPGDCNTKFGFGQGGANIQYQISNMYQLEGQPPTSLAGHAPTGRAVFVAGAARGVMGLLGY
jgi:hypothetical protein